jgi:hypothetical protein
LADRLALRTFVPLLAIVELESMIISGEVSKPPRRLQAKRDRGFMSVREESSVSRAWRESFAKGLWKVQSCDAPGRLIFV